jgi:hypothetical protein
LRNGYDIVTAGGGGGSVGSGQGGAATGTEQDAEPGLPSSNGGLGASSAKVGRGGNLFGDPRFVRATDGGLGSGGSSTFSLTKKAVGGGGGGGGYFGGGAGGFLGYTNDPNDVPTGGGGGSSYMKKLQGPVGVSGTREVAPYTNSPYYKAGTARGGHSSNLGVGGHGHVVIIATRRSNPVQNDNDWPTSGLNGTQLWVTKPNAFATMMSESYWGAVSPGETPKIQKADWSDKFLQLVIPPNEPGSPSTPGSIKAIFSGFGSLVVAVTESKDGSVYGELSDGTKYTHIWWGFTDTNATGPTVSVPTVITNRNTAAAFGPIQYRSDDGRTEYTVPALTNVRSIRELQPVNGARELVFIGDGIRIVSCPQSSARGAQWSNPRFVRDSDSGLPLDLTMKFLDAQYNQIKNELEMVGTPNALNVTTIMKSPWSPLFAAFYVQFALTAESFEFDPWNVYPDFTYA